MADRIDQDTINAISNWQATEQAVSSPLSSKVNDSIIDMLNYPDNFEQRRQIAYDMNSLSKQAGDLSTSLDNPEFEQSVNNKYGFQASQTNAATAAANLVADSQVAMETANRKINNLNQQKEINSKIVNDASKFMKSVSTPPLLGSILGIFDSDYDSSEQLSNVTNDVLQLNNLKQQDSLDDQILLEQAFGKAGYNPLANDVIEPMNRWEKQYYDELTALQRNKISATSNRISAKGGELEAYKAENQRLNTLASLYHDQLGVASDVYSSADKARDRAVQRETLAQRDFETKTQAGIAMLDSANRELANLTALSNKATDESIAKMDLEKAKLAANTAANQQVIDSLNAQTSAGRLAFDINQAPAKTQLEAQKLEASKDYNQAIREQAAANVRVAELGLAKKKLSKSTSGSADGAKPLTTQGTINLNDKISTTLANASSLLPNLGTYATMNNGILGNNKDFSANASIIAQTSAALAEQRNSPDFADKLLSDPSYAVSVANLESTLSQAMANTNDLINSGLDYGSESSKVITEMRKNNNGIVPASQTVAADEFLSSSNMPSNNGASLEGSLYNQYIKDGYNQALVSKWDSLTAQEKTKISKEAGVNENNTKYANNQQFVLDLVNSLKSRQNSLSSDTNKLLNRLLSNNTVSSFVSNIPITKIDPSGKISYVKDADGNNLTYKKSYFNSLNMDMDRYLAASITNMINAGYFGPESKASLNPDYSLSNGDADYELGMRMIDNGYSMRQVADAVKLFRQTSLVDKWAKDYLARSVSYDNVAASLIPVMGFYEFYDDVLATNSNYINNGRNSINSQEQELIARLQNYYNSRAAAALNREIIIDQFGNKNTKVR